MREAPAHEPLAHHRARDALPRIGSWRLHLRHFERPGIMHWKSAVCRANGIDIRYLRTGGGKPAVVLLHGLTGNGACWSPLARALEAEFDVVMPDARGHGASSKPSSGYRYGDFARDVVALIDELGLTTPVLVGHSMGGMTAAIVATHVDTSFRGVIFADPTFLSPERQREVYESDAVEQHRRLLASAPEAVLAEARVRHRHRTAEIVELVATARMQTPVEPFEVLTPPNPDYRDVVRAVSVPMLLVTADNGVVSRDTARELQRLNPMLRVEHVQDAGHGLPYDQPTRFEVAVKSFLRFVDHHR